MAADRQTVASAFARADSAHQKIDDHERLCAERYQSIRDQLGELKEGAKTTNRLLIGALLALVGWMGVQLWNTTTSHPPAVPAAAAK